MVDNTQDKNAVHEEVTLAHHEQFTDVCQPMFTKLFDLRSETFAVVQRIDTELVRVHEDVRELSARVSKIVEGNGGTPLAVLLDRSDRDIQSLQEGLTQVRTEHAKEVEAHQATQRDVRLASLRGLVTLIVGMLLALGGLVWATIT